MMNLVRCFITNDSGATAVEYGLIAVGIVVVATTALSAVFAITSGLFGLAVADFKAAGS